LGLASPPPTPHSFTYSYDASGVLHRTHTTTGALEHDAWGTWKAGAYVSPARERTVTIGGIAFADSAPSALWEAHLHRRQTQALQDTLRRERRSLARPTAPASALDALFSPS